MQSYIKNKRAKNDYCNICGQLSDLTWDHVPPKGCYNSHPVNVNEFFNGLPTAESYAMRYQNGYRFRSICNTCNNSLLGARYDVELVNFTSNVCQIITSPLIFPAVLSVNKVKVNKLTRAICGHLLAAKNYFDSECVVDKSLRRYFLEEDALPSENLKLLYWIYPYGTITAFRDVVVKGFNKNIPFPEEMFGMYSAFPLSFIVLDGASSCGLNNLFSYCTRNIDETVDIPIDTSSCYYPNTKDFRHFLWPCNVSEDSDGASAMFASDRNPSTIATRQISALRSEIQNNTKNRLPK